ncbi:MAG: hypothetical protein ACJ8FY_23645 [Gemmataceae bacterium]
MPTETLASGVSKEARAVAKATEIAKGRLSRTNYFGNWAAFDELAAVWEECQRPNWDGYEAVPVSRETLTTARQFLFSLPLSYPVPSIGAEPDGDLTVEWHFGPQRTLSVSITATGDLHYAALLGPSRAYGTEPFFGEVPDRILTLIRQAAGA